MTPEQSITFIHHHGIILESATAPIPNLVETITTTPIKGNWWSHPQAKEIFTLTRAVRASEDILVCRLYANKITFVHRRLWPALVRCADRFEPQRLARLVEEHTASGKHIVKEQPFPAWVPAAVMAQARELSEGAAFETVKACLGGR